MKRFVQYQVEVAPRGAAFRPLVDPQTRLLARGDRAWCESYVKEHGLHETKRGRALRVRRAP